MSLPTDQDYIDEAYAEIETLRQQLAEKDAEIERLNSSPTIEACRQMIRDKAVIEASMLHAQLVEYQERLTKALGLVGAESQTEAECNLREMIAKAGEAMRERCAKTPGKVLCLCDVEEIIRALPGVTLENLQ